MLRLMPYMQGCISLTQEYIYLLAGVLIGLTGQEMKPQSHAFYFEFESVVLCSILSYISYNVLKNVCVSEIQGGFDAEWCRLGRIQ